MCPLAVCRAQFTKIAVDWQVHAADDRYYDVMFVGTGEWPGETSTRRI